MVPPPIEYKVIIKPSLDYLARCGKLLLAPKDMADFLSVSPAKVYQMAHTSRLPVPIRLGIGQFPRWSVLELLDWIAAGCPCRDRWMEP